MEGKSSTQSVHSLYLMFANCVDVVRCWQKIVHVREIILKTIKCSSGRVECSFENPVGILLVSFGKKVRFCWKKLDFLKIGKGGCDEFVIVGHQFLSPCDEWGQ